MSARAPYVLAPREPKTSAEATLRNTMPTAISAIAVCFGSRGGDAPLGRPCSDDPPLCSPRYDPSGSRTRWAVKRLLRSWPAGGLPGMGVCTRDERMRPPTPWSTHRSPVRRPSPVHAPLLKPFGRHTPARPIGDAVFVGHGVMFVNDKHPRATA